MGIITARSRNGGRDHALDVLPFAEKIGWEGECRETEKGERKMIEIQKVVFEPCLLEVIRFCQEDVIATSGDAFDGKWDDLTGVGKNSEDLYN